MKNNILNKKIGFLVKTQHKIAKKGKFVELD